MRNFEDRHFWKASMRSQTFAAQSFGQKSAFKKVCSRKCRPKIAGFQFENVCSRKCRPKIAAFAIRKHLQRNLSLKISKFMSCKHFQREVSVKKCVRKRFERKVLAENMRSQMFAAENFDRKPRHFSSKTFAAENFGRKIRLKTFGAQSFGQKMRSQNFAAENFGQKSRHFRFTNVCSAKFGLQISNLMSCKHFQREVSVKKCDRKRFERKVLAENMRFG